MGWLIALGVFVLLAFFPLGVSAVYRQGGFMAWVLVGPVRIQAYPSKKKGDKNDQTEESLTQTKNAASKAKKTATEENGGSWKDFLPIVEVVRDFLGDLRRKIRVKYLKMHLTLACEDPCDLAVDYGRMNAAVAGLLAQLDRLFVVRKQDVQINCDFTAEQTLVAARLDLTITVARIVSLAARHGVRAFKTYSSIKKQREGGANL